MINLFYIRILLLPLLAGIGGVQGILFLESASKGLYGTERKFRRVKLWLCISAFMLSIELVYNNFPQYMPVLDLVVKVGVSSLLGLLWTFLFIQGASACGKTYEGKKYLSLWLAMTLVAVVFFQVFHK